MNAPHPDTVTIACPQCGTRYALPAGAIGAGGRKVSCTQCGSAWLARPVAPEPDPEAAAAALPTDMVPGTKATPEGVTRLSEADEDGLDSRFGDLEIKVKTPRKRQLGGLDLNAIGIEEVFNDGRASRYGRARAAARIRGPGERILGALRLLSFAVLALILGLALMFRNDLVRAAPELAALYRLAGFDVNVTGISISDLTTSTIKRGTTPVLTVNAILTNVTGTAVDVPDVVLNVLNDAGESLYGWSVTPPVPNIGPGDRMKIKTELSNPPVGATRVVMNFAGSPLPENLATPRNKRAIAPSFTVDQPTPLDTNDKSIAATPPSDAAETAH